MNPTLELILIISVTIALTGVGLLTIVAAINEINTIKERRKIKNSWKNGATTNQTTRKHNVQ